MDERDYIYGPKPKDDELVVVKVCVPRVLKTRLESLKLLSGRNIQDMATEAILDYLGRIETQVRRMADAGYPVRQAIEVQVR